jgi:putative flavoprotein involved in K+ transport
MSTNRSKIGSKGGHLVEEGEAFMKLEGRDLRASMKGGSTETTRHSRSGDDSRAGKERFDVVVIGAGQAGLSVGYHLARRGVSFVILDAAQRVGDSWRKRWDSLRLFTPARFDGLDGMAFPAPPYSFPTKNEMGDYLEAYAARFKLPIRSGVKVDRLSKHEGRYVVEAGTLTLEADQVVVAMASYQRRKVPAFAAGLRTDIVQIHSSEYRNPTQLREGGVLIAGAGNSGAEIARELARDHRVWVSGRDTGHVPFRIDGFWARLFLSRFVLRFLFHRVLTVKTPIGRKARAKALHAGTPLIRVKPQDLVAAGVERVAKVAGVRDGLPLLEGDRVLDVTNVVWSTGYDLGLDWIDLPIFGSDGEPAHDAGVVRDQPGLYFVGLHFLYSMSSTMIHGVGRDAARIARAVAARAVGPAVARERQAARTAQGERRAAM